MNAYAPVTESIGSRTARGAGWLLGWRMATRTIGLISTMLLVRVLLPSDFGVVALGTGLAGAIETLSWMGVQAQLIREAAPTRVMFDTAFTINLLRSVAAGVAITAGSGLIAAFFGEPRLTPILIALGIVTALAGFENVGVVEFRRDFTFEKEFQLFVVPRIASALTTVGAAFLLHDYRALMAGIVTNRLLGLAYGYAIHPYRPRLSLVAWRPLLGFSFWTWAVSVTGLLRDRFDSLVVGRALGPTQVGIYSVALEVAALPITELIEPMGRVLFSGFAAARQSGSNQDAGYGRALGLVCLLVLPMTTGISLIAAPLTELMFGAQWDAAIPIVQLLALGGTLRLCSVVGGTLLTASGLPRTTFKVTFTVACVRVPLVLLLVSRFGLLGCATAVLLAMVLEELLYLIATFRRFHMTLGALGRVLWRPFLASAAMAATLHFTGLGWSSTGGNVPELLQTMVLAVVIGAATFCAVLGSSWLLVGAPSGPETDFFEFARHMGADVARWSRKRAGRMKAAWTR